MDSVKVSNFPSYRKLLYGLQIEFSNRNFYGALNCYSRALSFAEHGIFRELNDCVARVNRGITFSRMEKYQKALNDFTFASQKNAQSHFQQIYKKRIKENQVSNYQLTKSFHACSVR